MISNLPDVLAGDTKRYTLTTSGIGLTGLQYQLRSGATIVSTGAASTSAAGDYYAHLAVSTPGFWSLLWVGVHSTATFQNTVAALARFQVLGTS